MLAEGACSTAAAFYQLSRMDTTACRSSLNNRILLELFSEPDIFGFQWAATNVYNGITYPALPDIYGPTMHVRSPSLSALAQPCIH